MRPGVSLEPHTRSGLTIPTLQNAAAICKTQWSTHLGEMIWTVIIRF
jgi:hypothetical protein